MFFSAYVCLQHLATNQQPKTWGIYIYIYRIWINMEISGLGWTNNKHHVLLRGRFMCLTVDGHFASILPNKLWPTLAVQRQMWQWCLLFKIPSLASPCFAGQNEVSKFGGFPSLPWWIRCRLPLRSQLGHHLGFRIRIPQRIINQPG